MGQVIQTNGDYNIKSGEGATINLDTGFGVGTVRVTGNLLIQGNTLTVSTEDLNVRDNIIIVNYGETGDGVTLEYSGMQVDRGIADPAMFLYDERADAWLIGYQHEGLFTYDNSKLRVTQLLTNASTDSGDLTIIGAGTGVIKVVGTDHYEDQITHDDDVPNKKYVDDSIQNNPTWSIRSDDTRVISSDIDTAGSFALYTLATGYPISESAVSILVDGSLVSQYFIDRVKIQNLEFANNIVSNAETDENIFLNTTGTGKVQTNYALQLDHIASSPAYVLNSTVLHSKTISIGATGLFFVNDNAEAIKRTGELISKNKALVFSMLF